MLHGNPAVDIYGGIKLAGGGELGIGVGEEDWGSGEREVLEDFIKRTQGLVEMVVSRFGDAPEELDMGSPIDQSSTRKGKLRKRWYAGELDPRPSDGVLFSGPGFISRRSLATVSYWMKDIYKYGGSAYGVRESPDAGYRRRRRPMSPEPAGNRASSSLQARQQTEGEGSTSPATIDVDKVGQNDEATGPGIPPPLVQVVEQSLQNATTKAKSRATSPTSGKRMETQRKNQPDSTPFFNSDKMMKYLTLGYGSKRGTGQSPTSSDERRTELDGTWHPSLDKQVKRSTLDEKLPQSDSKRDLASPEANGSSQFPKDNHIYVQQVPRSIGKFLIGLAGDLEKQDLQDDNRDDDSRILIRTVTVETRRQSSGTSKQQETAIPVFSEEASLLAQGFPSHDLPENSGRKDKKLRVVVYQYQPFIFTFLFELDTPQLAYPSFYRSLHHQLGPLHKPLLHSTDPGQVAMRIADAMGQGHTTSPSSPTQSPTPPIYDLIFDPEKLTVHGSLPNIPLPQLESRWTTPKQQTVSGSWYTLGIPTSSSLSRTSSPLSHQTLHSPDEESKSNIRLNYSPWTRPQALSIHTQILNNYIATHRHRSRRKQQTLATATDPVFDSITHDSTSEDATAEPVVVVDDEFERLVKTNRGWWVLWMRVQGYVNAEDDPDINTGSAKEAILVRKAKEDDYNRRAGAGAGAGAAAARSSSGGGSGRSSSSSPNTRSDWAGTGMGSRLGIGWLLRDATKKDGNSNNAPDADVDASTDSTEITHSPTTTSSSSATAAAAAAAAAAATAKIGGVEAEGLAAISEGVGVDARKWVDGLLKLSR